MENQTLEPAPDGAPESYRAIRRAAIKRGWPVMHHADLTECDLRRLTTLDAPTHFVWVLREHGTLLLDARMTDYNATAYFQHLEGCRPDGSTCYTWDGSRLHEVSRHGARDFMRAHASDTGQTRY